MMKLKIRRPITKQDLQAIIDLIEENIVKYDTKMSWLESFADGEILLAVVGEEVVGAILMNRPGKIIGQYPEKYFDFKNVKVPKKKYALIPFLVVKKGFQGMGIGKKLVKEGIEELKNSGAKAIGVHCWQESPGNASQKLFESFGFEPLKMHHASWEEISKKAGPDDFYCLACGNPCVCDELEMVKYL